MDRATARRRPARLLDRRPGGWAAGGRELLVMLRGPPRPEHRRGDHPTVHEVATLETVKHHLKPNRQPSVGARQTRATGGPRGAAIHAAILPRLTYFTKTWHSLMC